MTAEPEGVCEKCGAFPYETTLFDTAHECKGEVRPAVNVARAETRDDNVALKLEAWSKDATRDLDEDHQDAHVTITARRAWAEYQRAKGDGWRPSRASSTEAE